jgi:hypothetical protein
MPAAAYGYAPAPYVVALQWTGDNIADFVAAGFTPDTIAVAQDGTTLILGATIPGYALDQYVPMPANSWIVSSPVYAPVPTPLPAISGLSVSVVDPSAFAATYALAVTA